MGKRIDEELVCIDALTYVLLNSCGCKTVTYERQTDDPPDFLVNIDQKEFPVEVTSITFLQGYDAQVRQFCSYLEKSAIKESILSGTYLLSVIGTPDIPKPTSIRGKELISTCISFMASTKDQETTSPRVFVEEFGGNLALEKSSRNEKRILQAQTRVHWIADAQANMINLVEDAVRSKKEKLSKKGILEGEAILLLYDAFAITDFDETQEAFSSVRNFDWFHSIVWVPTFSNRENINHPSEPGRGGIFLFSQNSAWEGARGF